MSPKMTPEDFVKKWNRMFLSEMAAAQSHFLDVCDLGRPSPSYRALPRRI